MAAGHYFTTHSSDIHVASVAINMRLSVRLCLMHLMLMHLQRIRCARQAGAEGAFGPRQGHVSHHETHTLDARPQRSPHHRQADGMSQVHRDATAT